MQRACSPTCERFAVEKLEVQMTSIRIEIDLFEWNGHELVGVHRVDGWLG